MFTQFQFTCAFVGLFVGITCSTLEDGTNTVTVDAEVTRVFGGANYTYECNDGFHNEATGALVSTCQTNGTWSLAPPTCSSKLSH